MRNIISNIKQHCDGQWDNVIEALTGFNGKPTYCPQHRGKSGQAFYGKKHDYARTGITFCNTCGCHNDGINTLAFITEKSIAEVVKMLIHYLGDIDTGNEVKIQVKPKIQANSHVIDERQHFKKATRDIKTLVKNSVVLGDARQYFINRGLKPLADCYYQDIRFAHAVSHYENEAEQKHNAILGVMRDLENNIRNIQRIFVDSDFNKANCLHPKKMMPSPKLGWHNGAAVWMKAKFNQMPKVLHISEGIENGHAVLNQSPFYIDMACCLTATNLTKFQMPENIKKLIIWADNDGDTVTPNGKAINTGLDSAHKLKLRVESCGIQAMIIVPDQKGDWNDYPRQCTVAWDNIAIPFIMM